LEYDVEPSKGYAKDFGYTSQFSEHYKTAQRQILAAVSRAYANFEESPSDKQLIAEVPGDVDFLGSKQNASHKRPSR